MRKHMAFLMFLSFCCAMSPGVSLAQGIQVVVESPTYSGVWAPDQDANRTLARATQKEMRKRMAKQMSRQMSSQMSKQGGGGGMPPGGIPPGGMGGMPPGGMGGMPPGGMGPPDMGPETDPLSMMSATGMLRPEMDFAAPLQGNLRIEADPKRVVLGKDGAEGVALAFHGGARELGEGDVRAFAGHENGNLVVEINTDDGVQVTHTYMLEAQGSRLRVKTLVISRDVPLPGGIPIERLFQRVDEQADASREGTRAR
jgi:hypothetical protein